MTIKKIGKFTDSEFWNALQERKDLTQYGKLNATLFALELMTSIDDISTIAADIIVDGPGDEKIDTLYFDEQKRSLYLIQSYQSQAFRLDGALPNKAADAAYAETVLLSADLNDIPERIRPHISAARESIANNTVEVIHIWYLHNCPESKECSRIMSVIGASVSDKIKHLYTDKSIRVDSREIGLETLNSFYTQQESAILITDNIEMGSSPGFFESSESGWIAFVTSIKGSFIKQLYDNYGEDKLFSANVRSFMGSNNKDQAINGEINKSAQSEPDNFFVRNNGITALVLGMNIQKESDRLGYLESINGISIINGAQTTGSISSLDHVDEKLKVVVRFIKVEDVESIRPIVLANNSQNKVLNSDFRSGDWLQKSLRRSFEAIPDAKYMGGLRKKLSPAERKIQLDNDTVAQVLTAFHGSPTDSYHSKSAIWEEESLYRAAFAETITAKHILFVYTLYEAITKIRNDYREKDKAGEIYGAEIKKLELLRQPGVSYLIISAVSRCIEMMLKRRVQDQFKLSFIDQLNRKDSVEIWVDVVTKMLIFSSSLLPASQNRLSRKDDIIRANEGLITQLDGLLQMNPEMFSEFSTKVKLA